MAKARLSMAFQDLRGSIGDRVVFKTRSGLAVRRKPVYKYPKNPDVQAGTQRFRQAAQAWGLLSKQELAAWWDYADSLARTDPVSLRRYTPSAKNVFMGLSCKFLQVNPEGEIPMWPPDSDFIGDNIAVDVESQPGEGFLFTTTGPNSPGVVTELLFQKLKSDRWRPAKFYKSLGFVHFEEAGEGIQVPLDPGVYAFAWRMVRADTGQATLEVPLGTEVLEEGLEESAIVPA